MSPPSVSVIIPVYDDYEQLETCLESIAKQAFPLERVEVIVVDNGTPDHRRRTFEKDGLTTHYLVEPKRGSYAARNAGLDVASSEVVAFTDADCIPSPTWLGAGVDALCRDSKIGLAAGCIEVVVEDDEHPTPVEAFEREYAFQQARYVREGRFGATANLFTRRDVIDQVGVFNDTLLSGGDREWGNRVAQAGFELVYAEHAVVRHPARKTIGELWSKIERIGQGHHRLHWVEASWYPDRLNYALHTIRNLLPPVRFLLETAADTSKSTSDKARLMAARTWYLYAAHYVRLRWIFRDLFDPR